MRKISKFQIEDEKNLFLNDRNFQILFTPIKYTEPIFRESMLFKRTDFFLGSKDILDKYELQQNPFQELFYSKYAVLITKEYSNNFKLSDILYSSSLVIDENNNSPKIMSYKLMEFICDLLNDENTRTYPLKGHSKQLYGDNDSYTLIWRLYTKDDSPIYDLWF
jgi:hypothetical protein